MAQRFVVDAKPEFHIRAEILSDDISLVRELAKYPEAVGIFEIERHAPLVAMQILKIRTVTLTAPPIRQMELRR